MAVISGTTTNPRLCCVEAGDFHEGGKSDLDKLFPPSWKSPSSLLEALQQAIVQRDNNVRDFSFLLFVGFSACGALCNIAVNTGV